MVESVPSLLPWCGEGTQLHFPTFSNYFHRQVYFYPLRSQACCWKKQGTKASGFSENAGFSYRDETAAVPGVTLTHLSHPSLLSTQRLGVGMRWGVPLFSSHNLPKGTGALGSLRREDLPASHQRIYSPGLPCIPTNQRWADIRASFGSISSAEPASLEPKELGERILPFKY